MPAFLAQPVPNTVTPGSRIEVVHDLHPCVPTAGLGVIVVRCRASRELSALNPSCAARMRPRFEWFRTQITSSSTVDASPPRSHPTCAYVPLATARVIGEHPESFPDTHGSPVLGMGYAALAAHADPGSFRRLMDANRWWFTLAECADGTCYHQPNRDNEGYGADARMSASAVVAFILSIPQRNLVVTGRDADTARKNPGR